MYLIIHIDENGWPTRVPTPDDEHGMTPAARATYNSLRGYYKAVQRSLLLQAREREARSGGEPTAHGHQEIRQGA